MHRIVGSIGAALFGLAALSGCSDDSVSSEDRDKAVDQLVSEAGMTQDQAECLVDGFIDEFGAEKILEVSEDPESLSEEEQNAMVDLTLDCLGDIEVPE